MKSIADFEREITEWGRRKGWDMSKCLSSDPEVKRDFMLHKLMLCVTELAEAAEAVRDDAYDMTGGEIENDRVTKPEGMLSELADTVIRIMHITGAMGYSLEHAIETKMAYNEKRPYQHGRKA